MESPQLHPSRREVGRRSSRKLPALGKGHRRAPGSLLLRQLLQARGELLVDAAEASIGEDRDYITAAKFGGDGLHDRIGISQKARGTAVVLDLRCQRRQFEALIFGNGF